MTVVERASKFLEKRVSRRSFINRSAFIGSAEHDPLRDDAALYAGLLNDAGVPAELSNESTLVHGYVSFALIVPAAAEATNRGLAALKAALH